MSSGKTNRGKFLVWDIFYRNATEMTNFFMALFDQTTAPTVDTNIKSELTEIPAGNGYVVGGISLNRNSTDFDVLTEDDVNDRALIQIKDLVWTASGPTLPASGTGARWACLTDDNVTQGSRLVIDFFDLVSNRIVSDTQSFTMVDTEMRLTE